MDDQDQGDGDLPMHPHDGEGDAELPHDGEGDAELPHDGGGDDELPLDGEDDDELPHDGEGDAELLERESPDGIFVVSDEDEPFEWANPESAPPEQEGSPGSSRATPMIIDDDEPAEEAQPDAPAEDAQPDAPEGSQPPEDEPASIQDEGDQSDGDSDSESEAPEDPAEYEITAACLGAPCQEQCDHLAQIMRQKNRTISRLLLLLKTKRRRIKFLNGKITLLASQVRRLGAVPIYGARRRAAPDLLRSFTPRGMTRWQDLLRRSISGNGDYNEADYRKAWKSCQQTLNMPVDIGKTHPFLRFVSARNSAEDEEPEGEESEDEEPENDPPGSPLISARWPADSELPDNVLFRILEHLLYYDKEICHCISRLDYYQPPETFPSREELGNSRTGMKGRFFFSDTQRAPVSLTHDTLDPNDVLAPSLVCRRWAFYSLNIFFGRNTFSFSSLVSS